jgi:hypothetical protein
MTIWEQLLASIHDQLPDDAGDQITVWVPSEAVRRHIAIHYQDDLERSLAALGRHNTHLRFVVAGVDEDEES